MADNKPHATLVNQEWLIPPPCPLKCGLGAMAILREAGRGLERYFSLSGGWDVASHRRGLSGITSRTNSDGRLYELRLRKRFAHHFCMWPFLRDPRCVWNGGKKEETGPFSA